MIIKALEIRDRMTFIPVLAISTEADNEGQRYLLARSGYGANSRLVILFNMNDSRASYDPYSWGGGRTMSKAHLHIQDNFASLQDGDVVDVEFLLGETSEPKKSEQGK